MIKKNFLLNISFPSSKHEKNYPSNQESDYNQIETWPKYQASSQGGCPPKIISRTQRQIVRDIKSKQINSAVEVQK